MFRQASHALPGLEKCNKEPKGRKIESKKRKKERKLGKHLEGRQEKRKSKEGTE